MIPVFALYLIITYYPIHYHWVICVVWGKLLNAALKGRHISAQGVEASLLVRKARAPAGRRQLQALGNDWEVDRAL